MCIRDSNTPARVPLSIKFVMTSQGNDSVSDEREVFFEVMQDHRWDIESVYDGMELGGTTIPISPGEIIQLPIIATNTGNLIDDLAVEVVHELLRSGEDSSQGWFSNGSEAFEVGVNQTISLTITNSVPFDSWNGSIMETNVSLVARNEVILQFSFKLEVNSEDFNEVQNGYALIKNDQFYYKTEEREVTSDGKNVWTYIFEDNECYIDLLTDLDNTINPSEIFTIWQSGFKYKYVRNKKTGRIQIVRFGSKQLSIKQSADVEGDLIRESLSIEDGAKLKIQALTKKGV